MCILSFIAGCLFALITFGALVWRFVVRESKEQMENHRRNQYHKWSNP